MEAILQFLMNNIASGAIGHYISKGLGKIDKDLPALIEGNADISEIENIVSKKSLENDIMKLADEVKNKIKNANTGNVINFTGGTNEGIVANKVEIKTIKNNVTIAAPHGTIASSLMHRNYSKYLIDRYHEFKKADVGKDKMNYAVFYGAIKREFGAKWDMIPLERFSELSSFIQRRIDNTILGKNKKSNNVKRYSSIDEYTAKHG